MKLEYLDWDSGSFGFKIGLIVLDNSLSESLLNNLMEQAKEEKYKLVYVFTPEYTDLSNEILMEQNGKLVDRKILYRLNVSGNNVEYDDTILDWSAKKLTDDILQLSYLSGQHSRFFIDKKFPIEAFENLYKEWIDKSLSGHLADRVFVAIENKQIIGFVTLKINEDIRNGEIGLIAVSEQAQGRRYGTKLVNQCIAYIQEKSMRSLTVATQMDNVQGCLFYERYGFLKDKITNVYHFWL